MARSTFSSNMCVSFGRQTLPLPAFATILAICMAAAVVAVNTSFVWGGERIVFFALPRSAQEPDHHAGRGEHAAPSTHRASVALISPGAEPVRRVHSRHEGVVTDPTAPVAPSPPGVIPHRATPQTPSTLVPVVSLSNNHIASHRISHVNNVPQIDPPVASSSEPVILPASRGLLLNPPENSFARGNRRSLSSQSTFSSHAPPRPTTGIALASDSSVGAASFASQESELEDPGYRQDREDAAANGSEAADGALPPPEVGSFAPGERLPRPPRILPEVAPTDRQPSPPTSVELDRATPGIDHTGNLCGCGPDGSTPASGNNPPQPWKLIDGPTLQALRISVGGWLEQGITFNAHEPASRYNGPLATNDRHADYQLNQLWAYVVRPTDTGGCGFDIGGRIDMVFGTDWRYGINRGLEDRINGVSQNYGLVIPQMYLEVAVNRLTVKLGHFAGILDYEAVPAILNPFYSHSYCYGYTVPQLVTGVLASYQVTDQIGVDAGFHRGWMMFEDNNDDLDFMGGIRWKSLSGRTQVAYGVSVGPQDDAGVQDRFVYSLVFRQKIGQRTEYILVHNLGWENDAVRWAPGAPRDAEWYGINQYFIYTISPKLSAGARIEWLRDDDGVRIAGVGNAVPGKGWSALPGFAGDFYELTLGLNWRPSPNWLIRPEIRWDWYDGTRNLQGQLPFNDGTSDHQFTFATDVILTF